MRFSIGGELALAAYVFPLAMAAVSDLHDLRIPNWMTGSLALAFPVVALVCGQPVDWLSHVAAGGAVLVAGALLFALQVMGGGDVKLLAATALWTGLGQLAPLLLLTAVIGGVFGLIILGLRHPFVQASLLQVLRRLPDFAQQKMPMPYGVPIALAGILIAPSLSVLG